MRASFVLPVVLLVGCGLRVDVLTDSTDAAAFDGATDAGVVPEGGIADAPVMGSGAFVATGQYHSCAIITGTLLCWGDGRNGALGLGDTSNRIRPARVPLARALLDVSLGEGFTCARTVEGEVWCFGANARGELGVGDTNPRSTPTKLTLPRSAAQIAAGYEHACAILDDGALVCWGENLEGQMGQNDSYPGANVLSPVRVGTDADWKSVSAGQGHVCGIRAPGTLWCWGRNSDSELGQGAGAPIQIRTPTRVGDASDWVQLDTGQNGACGVRADGSLWCWGGNAFGQAGTAPSTAITAPRQVGADRDWLEVSIDTFSTCARKRDGSLHCFGRNVEGALGVGDFTDRSSPTRAGTDLDWTQVSMGRFHACARKNTGAVACTGENVAGQLGVGDTNRRNVFTLVQ